MKNILRILIFSAGLAGINSIFQFISGIDIFTGNPLGRYGNFYRAAGSYGFFLSFAGNQLMALGMAMAFFFTEKNWRKDKYLYAIATVLIIVSLLTTFARSSWIAFVFMSLLIAIFINRRLFVINLGIILILCAAAFILNPDLQQRFLSIFDAQKNATRLNLIHTSLAMIADNPVTGIGSGMYGDMVPYYKYPGFYDTFCHAHNDHLQIAVISGLPGFFAWIVLWISWFYYTIKVLKKMKKYTVQHRILTGAVLGISGILIAGFFQCYYLDLKNAIFMAFILLVGVNAFKSQAQKNSGTG